MGNRKKTLGRISVLFVCVVAVLIFFSNTINNINLPCVSIGFPQKDEFVSLSITGVGPIEMRYKSSYFSEIEGIVDMYSNVGDYILEGQTLFSVTPVIDNIDKERERLSEEYALLELRIDKAQADFDYYSRKLDETVLELDDTPLDLSAYDMQIETLRLRLETMRADTALITELHVLGNASMYQVTEMENELKALELQYEHAISQRDAAIAAYERTGERQVEEARKYYDDLLDTYTKVIFDLEYQLRTMFMELRSLTARLEELDNPELTIFEAVAQEDCIIEQIFTEKGAYARKHEKVMAVGIANRQCKITFKMSENIRVVAVESPVMVDVPSKRINGLPGQVMAVRNDTGEMFVDVFVPPSPTKKGELAKYINGGALVGGETAVMDFIFETGPRENVVPNSAVHMDSNGYYVLSVVPRPGAFGREYVAQKIYVGIQVSNEYYSALSPYGFTLEYPIIMNSNRVVNDGDRVRLADGDDFYETR